MDKIYIKFIFGTDYSGTEFTQYAAYDAETPDHQLDQDAEELAMINAENYEYLALDDPANCDNDDEDNILTNFYYNDVYYWWERVTKEEYEENT